MRFPHVVSLAAVAVVVGLAGCAGPTPIALPTTPVDEPMFASDEEALAAAVEVYEAYVEAANVMARSGWIDVESVRPFVTDSYFEVVQRDAEELRPAGKRLDGASGFDSAKLQSVAQSGKDTVVRMYVCVDVSETVVINDEGRDITSSDRRLRTPFEIEVSFQVSPAVGLISAESAWPGPDFC